MSYNSLHVPLDIGTWQCVLVPAREFYHEWHCRARWNRFADRDTRTRMQRQIDDDRRIFERYFRPNYNFARLIATDTDAIASFLTDHLNVVHWDLPTDNAGIERALKQAVADGKLVPVVNRDYRGIQRTFRPTPEPLYWPPSGSSGTAHGKSITYEVFLALRDASADTTTEGRRVPSDSDDAPAPLEGAQPFQYRRHAVEGDVLDLAKTPNVGEPGTWYTIPAAVRCACSARTADRRSIWTSTISIMD